MTLLEQLLAKPLAELEAMTDTELEDYFAPVLEMTRPKEKQIRVTKKYVEKLVGLTPAQQEIWERMQSKLR